jgi:hypothetical protein
MIGFSDLLRQAWARRRYELLLLGQGSPGRLGSFFWDKGLNFFSESEALPEGSLLSENGLAEDLPLTGS